MIKSKVLADSICWTEDRVVTILTEFPYRLLVELERHRRFSFNVNSTRAIPLSKMIDFVTENPFIPIFTLNQSGMQGVIDDKEEYKWKWLDCIGRAVQSARELNELGLHKQVSNLPLIPFLKVDMIITANYYAWKDMFDLRCTEAAEPNFRLYAEHWKQLIENSEPNPLKKGEWHIPFARGQNVNENLYISASSCARISYDNERDETIEVHKNRHDKCLENKHSSVFEHQLQAPLIDYSLYPSNITGWIQYRKLLYL